MPVVIRVREQQLGDAQVVGVVTLRFSGAGLDDPHHPARPLDQPGVVGGARQQLVGCLAQRPLERRPAEHLRRLDRPQSRALERARTSARRRRPP